MKCWTEVAKDAFSYFAWFSKTKAELFIGYQPALSVFSLNGSMIFQKEDKKIFKELCSQMISKLILERGLMQTYRFYLFAVADNSNSKIARHLKLWKNLKRDWNLDNFILGPEVEYVKHDRLSYASVAEFKADEFLNALEIITSNPKKYSIIASQRHDFLSEGSIKSLFEFAYLESETRDEIDYFKLALTSCLKGDLIFRWGTSSEECELGIVILESNLELFQGLSLIYP